MYTYITYPYITNIFLCLFRKQQGFNFRLHAPIEYKSRIRVNILVVLQKALLLDSFLHMRREALERGNIEYVALTR